MINFPKLTCSTNQKEPFNLLTGLSLFSREWGPFSVPLYCVQGYALCIEMLLYSGSRNFTTDCTVATKSTLFPKRNAGLIHPFFLLILGH